MGPPDRRLPAEYGMAGSYAASRDIGTANLVDAIAAQKGRPVALLGYSQGAQIVGDTAELVASTGYDPLADVRAVALVSDPPCGPPASRSAVSALATASRGSGTSSPTSPSSLAANPLDAITCAKYDAMLRTVADFTEYMALNDVLGWALDVLTKLDSFGWQKRMGRIESARHPAPAAPSQPGQEGSARLPAGRSARQRLQHQPRRRPAHVLRRRAHRTHGASPTAAGSLTSSTRSERPCDHPR
ncbi:PE-PPE domain-containing protein [Rhodococcus hoagii]|nr:PE-PPE domain-containing protein [Prescottella equi]